MCFHVIIFFFLSFFLDIFYHSFLLFLTLCKSNLLAYSIILYLNILFYSNIAFSSHTFSQPLRRLVSYSTHTLSSPLIILSHILLMLYSSLSLSLLYSFHSIYFLTPYFYLISSHLFVLLILFACSFHTLTVSMPSSTVLTLNFLFLTFHALAFYSHLDPKVQSHMITSSIIQGNNITLSVLGILIRT